MLLADRGERPRKQGIENEIRTALEPLPGVRSEVGLGGSGEKYILVLSGEDPQALRAAPRWPWRRTCAPSPASAR